MQYRLECVVKPECGACHSREGHELVGIRLGTVVDPRLYLSACMRLVKGDVYIDNWLPFSAIRSILSPPLAPFAFSRDAVRLADASSIVLYLESEMDTLH